MDYPDDDNGDALRRLQADGDDLTRARDINFTVVFQDQFKADQFAQHFRNAGYKSKVEEAQVKKTHPWDVVVVKRMIPTHSGIIKFEAELQAIAGTLEGCNDGWGCFAISSRTNVSH